jgi:O-antigen/teichoic acid export membrane protein
VAKKAVKYGLILAPVAMIYSFGTVVDRLIVGWFLGVESVAILQLGLAIGGVAMMLSSWFGMAFDPHLISWVAEKSLSQHRENLQKLAYALALTISSMAIGAAIWSDWLFYVLYPKEYASSAELVPVLVLASMFPLLSRIAIATVLLKDKPIVLTYVFLLGFVVNGLLSILLVPEIGIIGAVIGTAIAECVIFTSWVIFGRLIYKNFLIAWWPAYFFSVVASIVIIFMPAAGVGTSLDLLVALGSTCLLAIYYFICLIQIIGLKSVVLILTNPARYFL